MHAIEAAKPIADHAARLSASVVFGAWCGSRIAGMVGLKREEGAKERHKGFVWGFFVVPDCRGQGVGAALFAALLEVAPGVVEQLTLAVIQGNEAAMRLYRRFGFVVYGVEQRSLKSGADYFDEVLMARRL